MFALSACTSGLLVRNLDWLLERYVDDYFDLDDSQSELLSELVESSAERSSTNSIPAVLALLDQIIELNRQAELHQALPGLADSFEALGDRLAEDNTDNLVQFALTVTADQRAQIAAELSNRNRKYAKKHIEPGEQARRQEFEKDVRRSAKRWLGRLSEEQETMLLGYVAEYRLNEAEWMISREAWQAEFLKALAWPDGDPKKRRLKILIDSPESAFSAQQRADSEFNQELSISRLQPVLLASSEKQRERIEKQLRKLRKRISGFHQALAPDLEAKAPETELAR
ncbi:MAG: DUF6279 family lipoprotein [Pseudomonadales bacterium]